jgi:hypothetical protein
VAAARLDGIDLLRRRPDLVLPARRISAFRDGRRGAVHDPSQLLQRAQSAGGDRTGVPQRPAADPALFLRARSAAVDPSDQHRRRSRFAWREGGLEIPRHLKLAKMRDEKMVAGLIRYNWARTIALTVQAFATLALWVHFSWCVEAYSAATRVESNCASSSPLAYFVAMAESGTTLIFEAQPSQPNSWKRCLQTFRIASLAGFR